jgi:hypothetical protein
LGNVTARRFGLKGVARAVRAAVKTQRFVVVEGDVGVLKGRIWLGVGIRLQGLVSARNVGICSSK